MTGFFGRNDALAVGEEAFLLQRMTDSVVHRGPDDVGYWFDGDRSIGLGHRRLSILDLSPAGHQPMVSMSGRYVITFNGEIYNHLELRQRLGHAAWRGYSDTETLLAGFEAWGVEATLKKTVGMFAIALWDRSLQTLTLARDRLGEKPLYYGWQQGVFLFGSELKALKQHPAFVGEVDRDALTLYVRYAYIPAPYSIYRKIYKLLPGTFLSVRMGEKQLSKPTPFWSLEEVAERGQKQPIQVSDAEAVSRLEAKLSDAVRAQQIADVPVGAFLSGGVDSSAIVALMQKQSSRPVRTFTIGFEEAEYNEAKHAKAIAVYLGTDHTEQYVTSLQTQAVIPKLATLYDEPFADSSQIPTYLVSQMAREKVTVSLSGDAGDELFGGYNRYTWAEKILHWPRFLRKVFSKGITVLSPSTWNQFYNAVRHTLPKNSHLSLPGDKAHKLAGILGSDNLASIYLGLVSAWATPEEIVINCKEPITLAKALSALTDTFLSENSMMYLDAMSYLPDDILVKVDRAAMGVSLETRVPFLDHRVVEFAWQLPLSMKIRHGQGKWLLRQLLYQHVPIELIERPKMGFSVPIDAWLRGPLRAWAEDLLSEPRLRAEGYFNSTPIQLKWREHLSGQRNWQHCLWTVLMFQAWLERWK